MTNAAATCIIFFLCATYLTTGIDAQASKITDADIKALVDTLNSLRSALAKGTLKDKNGKAMDKSNNMLKMVWDASLAADSQKWADACAFTHSGNERNAGENLYAGAASSQPTVQTVFVNGINSWWNELTASWIYRPNNVFYGNETGVVGHYTQLAWANSYKIGCGYAVCNGKIFGASWPNDYLLVCRFRDTGNYLTQPVYNPSTATCTVGQKCSASKTQSTATCGADGLCTVA